MMESSIWFATVLLITTTKNENSKKESETTIQAESDFGDSQGLDLEGPLGGTTCQRSSTFKHPRSKDSNSKTPLPHLILYLPNIYPKVIGKGKDVSQQENKKKSPRLCLDYGLKEGKDIDKGIMKWRNSIMSLVSLSFSFRLASPCTNSSTYSQKKLTLPHCYCRTRYA